MRPRSRISRISETKRMKTTQMRRGDGSERRHGETVDGCKLIIGTCKEKLGSRIFFSWDLVLRNDAHAPFKSSMLWLENKETHMGRTTERSSFRG